MGYRTIVLIRCAVASGSANKKLSFPEVGERPKPFPKYSGLPSADTFDSRYKIFLVGRGVGNRGHEAGLHRLLPNNPPKGAQPRRMLDQFDAGDALMVTRLDRLARSTRDLLNTSRRSPARKPISVRSATHGPTLPHTHGRRCSPCLAASPSSSAS